MKPLCILALLLAVTLGAQQPAIAADPDTTSGTAVPAPATVPAGAYHLDKAHASLSFHVNHLGFSNYVARFKRFDAELQFDPADIAASSVVVTVDPGSLDLDNPPEVFTQTLLGEQWLDAAQFPQMQFRSTRVESTGANTIRILGDFTLHGVTKPVVLEATYNGGYAGHPMDPHARIGFSARGTLMRSDYGIAYGIPAPGTTMGVSDAVEVVVEAEFSGPPYSPEPAPDANPR